MTVKTVVTLAYSVHPRCRLARLLIFPPLPKPLQVASLHWKIRMGKLLFWELLRPWRKNEDAERENGELNASVNSVVYNSNRNSLHLFCYEIGFDVRQIVAFREACDFLWVTVLRWPLWTFDFKMPFGTWTLKECCQIKFSQLVVFVC